MQAHPATQPTCQLSPWKRTPLVAGGEQSQKEGEEKYAESIQSLTRVACASMPQVARDAMATPSQPFIHQTKAGHRECACWPARQIRPTVRHLNCSPSSSSPGGLRRLLGPPVPSLGGRLVPGMTMPLGRITVTTASASSPSHCCAPAAGAAAGIAAAVVAVRLLPSGGVAARARERGRMATWCFAWE